MKVNTWMTIVRDTSILPVTAQDVRDYASPFVFTQTDSEIEKIIEGVTSFFEATTNFIVYPTVLTGKTYEPHGCVVRWRFDSTYVFYKRNVKSLDLIKYYPSTWNEDQTIPKTLLSPIATYYNFKPELDPLNGPFYDYDIIKYPHIVLKERQICEGLVTLPVPYKYENTVEFQLSAGYQDPLTDTASDIKQLIISQASLVLQDECTCECSVKNDYIASLYKKYLSWNLTFGSYNFG